MIKTENLSLSSVSNWAFPCPTIKFVFKDINGLDGVKFSRKATTIGFRSFGQSYEILMRRCNRLVFINFTDASAKFKSKQTADGGVRKILRLVSATLIERVFVNSIPL